MPRWSSVTIAQTGTRGMTVADPDRITTSDEVTLSVRRWSAPGARAAVVLVHGFSASSADGAVVRQADALVRAGFEVVSYDGRGHGTSGGLCTLGDLEYLDVTAAVASARAETGLPVVVVGASMGAIAVLRYAASAVERPAGIVAISCPAAWRTPRTLRAMLATGLTQTRMGRRIAARLLGARLAAGWNNPDPPVTLVARLEIPVAFIHGEDDHFIPSRDAVELYRTCHAPRRLDLVPGMGHAYHELAVAPVVAAVEWALAASRVAVAAI
jgi:alpha-beta hydrolase superfamily lysophospholipase